MLAVQRTGKYNSFNILNKQIALKFSHKKCWRSLFGNLATGHFPEKIFFDGHSSGHTRSNEISLEFLSCSGAEQMGGLTHFE